MSAGRKIDLAIVGGGPAGLMLALGLKKYNVHCTVYEAAQSFREIGAGLALGPNAMRAMRLFEPDMAPLMKAWIGTPTDANARRPWFHFRWGFATPPRNGACKADDLFYTQECAGELANVHRAKFLDQVLALLPQDQCYFGKRLTSVEFLARQTRVHLQFADGYDAVHDAVIGADGIKSTLRKYVVGTGAPNVHPVYSGFYCYRGLVPMSAAVEAIGETLATENNVYIGPGGHLLTFPINGGTTMNGKSQECSTIS